LTKDRPKNLAASVRARLREVARASGEDFQLVLVRYGLERLLYRLSCSTHRDSFVLKGAMLFQLWSKEPHRATRDVDFLCRGEISIGRYEQVLREICETVVEDDGLRFMPASVKGEQIKEDDEYQGIRVRLKALLERAAIRFHVDLGFGDVVTPGPTETEFPTILPFPGPKLLAYTKETVVAEKFQAVVMLGMLNSRMKDFYDLAVMAERFSFEGPVLCRAIQATFARRKTEVPGSTPPGLSAAFAGDATKQRQWRGFLDKGRLQGPPGELGSVLSLVRGFLMPPAEAVAASKEFEFVWRPQGPWVQSGEI
jgi:predicted nucleotidyltransferase component of viral defense system